MLTLISYQESSHEHDHGWVDYEKSQLFITNPNTIKETAAQAFDYEKTNLKEFWKHTILIDGEVYEHQSFFESLIAKFRKEWEDGEEERWVAQQKKNAIAHKRAQRKKDKETYLRLKEKFKGEKL